MIDTATGQVGDSLRRAAAACAHADPGFEAWDATTDRQRSRQHKLLTDWARQGMLQLCRWLPGREIVFVGDSSFAVHDLAHAVDGRATMISRLRLDANLFAPPPPRHAHTLGRPALKGQPLPQLKTLLTNTSVPWRRITVSAWYGHKEPKALDITSDTALWYSRGTPPTPVRWVLVRDPDLTLTASAGLIAVIAVIV